MKINTILTERAIIQEQILADSTYREFYKLGVLLREYDMSQEQIQDVFKQVAQGAIAGGNVDKEGDAPASNRTILGKGADVASAVADKYRGLKQWIGQTGPVKGLDAMIDSLQQQIVEKTGGEAGKLSQTVEFYRELSRVPGMALAVKAIIVGTLGLATAGLGGVAIAAGLTAANKMLQGDKFSSAVMGAMETGGTVAAIQTAKDLLTTTRVGADYGDADDRSFGEIPKTPDPSTGLPLDPNSRADYTTPDDIGSATEYKVTAADGKLGVGGIAQKYPGISAQDIIDYNNLSPDGLIKPGQVLQIPEPNVVSPASTNVWDRYEGPGPKDMDAVSDRANNLFKMQQDADAEFYKNKPDDFGVPARSNDAVGNGMPGQFNSDAAGETIKALKSGEQMSLAKDWAQKMGMDPSDIKVGTTGSVPTTINGQPVPQEFYSPAQLKLIDGANQLRGGLNQSYVNPKSMMREWIDVDTTARMWMLRESIGKSRGGVYLTNEGVRAVFKEVVRRSVVNEGPWLDKLKGFNKKASDVIGKVTKPLGDIARAGWDSASNKITYGDLDMNWRRSAKLDKEASVDSEQVKQFLKAQGVNDPLIDASFKALGLDKGTPATTVEPAATPTEPTTAKTAEPTANKNAGVGFNASNVMKMPGMEKYAKQPSWADPKSKDYVGRREVTRRQQAQAAAGGAPAAPGTPATPSAQGAAEEPSSFWDAAGKDIANTLSGASDAIERGRNAYIGGSVADQTHPNKGKGNGLEIADKTGKRTKYIQQGDKWLTQDGKEVDPAMAAMLTARAAQQATTATTPTATTPTTATTATTPTATTPATTTTTPATTATTPTATTPATTAPTATPGEPVTPTPTPSTTTAAEPAQATATTGTTAAPAAPTTAKLPTATSSTAGQPSKISYDPKMLAKPGAKPAPTTAATPEEPAATQTAANPFGQMAGTLKTYAPPEPTSTGGTLKQTATGQVHRASATNPNAQPQQATTPTKKPQTANPFAGLGQPAGTFKGRQPKTQVAEPVAESRVDFGAMLWTKMRDSK